MLDDPEEIIDLSELSNVTSFVKIVDVSVSSEEEGMEIDSNANTTGLEMIMGHDPTNQTIESMVLRFMGDIQMEQQRTRARWNKLQNKELKLWLLVLC